MKRIDPRSVLVTLAALAVLGLVVAGGVVGLGLYNVSAKVGHLPGVSWVLHTTYRNSVQLRAGGSPPQDLRTDAMASLGAKHFDAACRTCHAAPGQTQTATIEAMVPAPPHITRAVGTWSASELHWILYEGVKMSGMPQWPSDRPSEVWAVVAFLERVQEGMTGPEYDRLIAAPATAVPAAATLGADAVSATPRDVAASDADGGLAYCISCHGADGVSGNPHIPRLDIQSETYMTRSLLAYLSGDRDSGIMEHAASEVERADLAAFAARIGRLEARGPSRPMSTLALRGKRIAESGGAGNVPACTACHGPWPAPISEAYPSLAGQYVPYLTEQLHLWRAGNRGGTQAAELMHAAARNLEDDEIAALAAYYAALAPAEVNAAVNSD